ncbi:MAG: hypothetical protein EA423_02625 [Phycisphaerales bacterium]|nr:MAG: hypothetical protein EA423_02625 [Phycisphaerales bacterium]
MTLLYLSPNMAEYAWASYQQDVMDELARQAAVSFYGPGFPGYRPDQTLQQVIGRMPEPPSCVIVGHAWLNDNPAKPLDAHPRFGLARSPAPVVMILNKEYVRLDEKLSWAREIGASGVFSHHHDAPGWSDIVGSACEFWPFAADHRKFFALGDPREIDLFFSGILQNAPVGQSDLRVRIMASLFHCEGDLPLRKRDEFAELNLFFNALPRDPAEREAAERRGLYRRLSEREYAATMRKSRLVISTRSPAGLVSPRTFEAMFSGSLVLAEHNPVHRLILGEHAPAEFENERECIDRALRLLSDPDTPRRAELARLHALEHHTWAARIGAMLDRVERQAGPIRRVAAAA